MIFATENYIEILKGELEKRCGANPSYSLRAFARDLNISAPRLSLVLNGKQGISCELAAKIAERLGMNEREKEYFCDLIESKHARSKLKKQLAEKRVKAKQLTSSTDPLTFEVLRIVSDWYHYAILELTYIKGFKSNIKWIASSLGIKEQMAEAAINRLIKVGLLEKTDGEYKASEDFSMSPDGISSESIKKFHKQIMDKAKVAIDTQSIQERDYSSVTFAFDTDDMGKVKNDIKDFRRDLLQKYGQTLNSNSVYNLSIQFQKLAGGAHNEGNN